MYNTYGDYTTYPSCSGYTSYDNYPTTGIGNPIAYTSFEDDDDDRLLAPFLLGGLAGAAVAPYFYRPFPFYGPFFPPYRPFFF